MTQYDPVPVLGVRRRIEQALATAGVVLGTARHKDGTTTPALVVGDWPEGTTVEGLEIILSRNPQQQPVPGFDYMGFIRSWPVRAVNHSGREDLEAVANALAEEFWPLWAGPDLLPATTDYFEQMTLEVVADQPKEG